MGERSRGYEDEDEGGAGDEEPGEGNGGGDELGGEDAGEEGFPTALLVNEVAGFRGRTEGQYTK